jgi:hypothetical protein
MFPSALKLPEYLRPIQLTGPTVSLGSWGPRGIPSGYVTMMFEYDIIIIDR